MVAVPAAAAAAPRVRVVVTFWAGVAFDAAVVARRLGAVVGEEGGGGRGDRGVCGRAHER